MPKPESQIPLGTYDVFRDVQSWDERTASQWASALNLRASADDQKTLRSKLLDLAQLQLNQTAVEIGCGTGSLLLDLASAVGRSGRVVGVEPQPVFAAFAKKLISEHNLDDLISVITDSAEHLPLSDAIADSCIAQTVLIHLPPEICQQALKEMVRIVKPGGRVLSADQDGDTWIINHPERELTRRIIQFNSDQRYADGWTGRLLESLFRNAGLINVKALPHVHIDRNADSYLFGMAKRIAEAAKDKDILKEDEYILWSDRLEETARKGDFFSSINYYCCMGSKP
ncbi:MAG: methyltransferase domain-containing protein [Ignavibacteriales bacterium]